AAGGCEARLPALPRARAGRRSRARAGWSGPTLRCRARLSAPALGARPCPGEAHWRQRPLDGRRPPRARAGDPAHRLAAERGGEARSGRPHPPIAAVTGQDRGERLHATKASEGRGGSARERPALSVVVPVYNEEENVQPLVAAIRNALAYTDSWELLLVDDGSTDATVAVAEGLAAQDR